ncbi:MAG: ATP-binding protein [Acidimicrobiales bacterium]|jgi:predicted ATPase
MRKIPISGGPHTGKTTLFNALMEEFPDAHFLAEPAGIVMDREMKKEQGTEGYAGVFPWNNYPAFARLVIDQSVELEASIPPGTDLVFQDRSLIDNIGYGHLLKYTELLPELERHIEAARYTCVLFCSPVGTYTRTEVRWETSEEAQRTHEFLSLAHDGCGVPVLHLPPVPTEERLAIIRVTLATL